MASKPPPSIPPSQAGVPSGGNGKFIAIALLLLLGGGGLVWWKLGQKPDGGGAVAMPSASAAPAPTRTIEDDIPPPPVEEDSGATPGPKTPVGPTHSTFGCEVKSCGGKAGKDFEVMLAARIKQSSRRCYLPALAQDSSLKGKMSMTVRIGTNGSVCSARVDKNEMGNDAVAQCIANFFRQGFFPAPHGGCVDANIPVNLVPGQ